VGSRIRRFVPGVVYAVTVRTNNREFLFRPNHDPASPLLEAGCAPQSLDPKNDLVPRQSVINLIGACLGRALAKHPIRIHWFECNLDHLHIGFSVDDEAMAANAAPFFRMVASAIARGVNKLWARENHVFGERYRAAPCLDDACAEQQLLYAVTNAVKDGQVARVADEPFFSTFRDLVAGESPRFWRIDWAAWWRKGGPRRDNRPKDFLEWLTVELAPLLGHAGLTPHQRRTRIRHAVRDIERATAERLELEGREVVGFARLRALDPRDRPRNPKSSGRQPLCHTSDTATRREYKREWREFVHEYRRASADYRNGTFEREFPIGSYRPPLITPYAASAL
jgi:hypothetical protein